MLQLCLLIAMVNILRNSIRMIFKKPMNVFIICEDIVPILIPDRSLVEGSMDGLLIKGSCRQSLVEGTADGSLVKGSPNWSLVEGSPDTSLVEGSPDASQVEGSPDASLVEGSPEWSLVETSPELQLSDDELREGIQQLHQDSKDTHLSYKSPQQQSRA